MSENSVEEIVAAIQQSYPGDTQQVHKLVNELIYHHNKNPITKNVAVTKEGAQFVGHHIDNEDNYWSAPLTKQKGIDYQSETPGYLAASLVSDESVVPAVVRFLDPEQSIENRVEALQELVHQNDAEASNSVLLSLSQVELASSLIPYVVGATELLRFEKPEDQTFLWEKLLQIALEYRGRNESFAERTTWTAVRRCASLIPAAEIEQLLPLLDFKGAVDCKLVTLQGLKSIFEVKFASFVGTEPVAKRVFELASSYTTRDILLPGESSAIAIASIEFLATVGHPRLGELIKRVVELEMPWFSKFAIRALKSTLKQSDEFEHPTFQLIQTAISSLESNLVEQSK